MTRLGRALAFAAWVAALALPVVPSAYAGQALPAEICSADGARTLPLDHPDSGHSTECPCCTSSGAAALPAPRPGTASPVAIAARPRHAAPAQCAATLIPLPPSRGPPA